MKTLPMVSDREIARRVRAIKKTWTKSERNARHVEAERRQQQLASMLGLNVIRIDGSSYPCAS